MKKLLAILVLTIGFYSNANGQAPMLSIPIVNSDFELQPTVPTGTINDPVGCGTYEIGQVPSWTLEQVGTYGGGGIAHWTCDDGMPNSNVAWLGLGERMYQLLTEKARLGVYVLQFDVAAWFYVYPGNWKAELYQGTADANGKVTLSPAPFCSESGWAFGDMKRITVTCPLPGYFLNITSPDPLGVGGQNPGGNIVVLFQEGTNPALGGHSGWYILIDNVSLTFAPTN